VVSCRTGTSSVLGCLQVDGVTILATAGVISATGLTAANVKTYGAVGDCATDDTAAFQSAWDAAKGTSGIGRVYVPPTANCYLVTKINGTNADSVIVEGNGDQSLIKVNGADANSNWWDLSGSSNISFQNLKFIDNGSAKAILFLWACTGTNCGTSGILQGLSFDRVNLSVKTTSAALYGYGFGCIAGSGCKGGGSLSITNSTWTQTNNGAASVDYETGVQNALLVLDAQNSRNVRSVNVTLTTTAAVTWRGNIRNVDFIDYANGAARSNNSAVVLYNVNQLNISGGSFQCVCFADVGIYHQSEGITQLRRWNGQTPHRRCHFVHALPLGRQTDDDDRHVRDARAGSLERRDELSIWPASLHLRRREIDEKPLAGGGSIAGRHQRLCLFPPLFRSSAFLVAEVYLRLPIDRLGIDAEWNRQLL